LQPGPIAVRPPAATSTTEKPPRITPLSPSERLATVNQYALTAMTQKSFEDIDKNENRVLSKRELTNTAAAPGANFAQYLNTNIDVIRENRTVHYMPGYLPRDFAQGISHRDLSLLEAASSLDPSAMSSYANHSALHTKIFALGATFGGVTAIFSTAAGFLAPNLKTGLKLSLSGIALGAAAAGVGYFAARELELSRLNYLRNHIQRDSVIDQIARPR
jgi:hypothetical protein